MDFSKIGLFTEGGFSEVINPNYELNFLRHQKSKLSAEVSRFQKIIEDKQLFIDAQRLYLDRLLSK